MADKSTLVGCVVWEIRSYLLKFAHLQNKKAVLLFPLPASKHTNLCIKIVATILNLMVYNIEGNMFVGCIKDFRKLLDLIDSPSGALKLPEDLRRSYNMPFIDYSVIYVDNYAPFIETVRTAFKNLPVQDEDDVESLHCSDVEDNNAEIEGLSAGSFENSVDMAQVNKLVVCDENSDREFEGLLLSTTENFFFDVEVPLNCQAVREGNGQIRTYITEYSDGSSHLCIERNRKLVTYSASTSTKEMSTQTLNENSIKCMLNKDPGEAENYVRLSDWNSIKNLGSFTRRFKQCFGSDTTLVLVQARFSSVEDHPMYDLFHVVTGYNIPDGLSVESAYNIPFYTRWWNPTTAIVITRSAEDANEIKNVPRDFTVQHIDETCSEAILTAYSFIPYPCPDYSVPPYATKP